MSTIPRELTASFAFLSWATLNKTLITIYLAFAAGTDCIAFPITFFVKPLGTSQAMNKGLDSFSFFPTLLTTIFHQLVEVSIFVKFIYFLFITLLTKSWFFKSASTIAQTVLVIVVLAKRTLHHMGIGIPSLAFLTNFNFMLDGINGRVFLLGLLLVSRDKAVHFDNEFSWCEVTMLFLKHFDERIEVVVEGLVLGDREWAYGGRAGFAFFEFFSHYRDVKGRNNN